MQLVDWAIVIVMVMAALAGLTQGFFRSVCSLGGLLLGLAIAAWNYERIARLVLPLVRVEAVANAIGFLLIALLVMALAGVIGNLVAKTLRQLGLGWLDALVGAAFGVLQGAVLVMLVVLVTLAFFPTARWLAEAKLPRVFFGACHLTTHMSPAELADRVRHALKALEEESPEWMHPGSRGV
jgi:membrane protein required for colicin V production